MTGVETNADFYEEDEPVEKIVAAFERGEKGLTGRPTWARTEFLSALVAARPVERFDNEPAGNQLVTH